MDYEAERQIDWRGLVHVGIVAAAIIVAWHPFSLSSFVSIVGVVIGGYPIYREAIEALTERRMTMELSMTIAIAAALAIGEFFTALVIVLFVLVAEILEHLTTSRGRSAIRSLLELLPLNVTVRQEGNSRDIHISELQSGDLILLRPGSRIPVDGTVTTGYSFVDQSSITGESAPAEKIAGARVYSVTADRKTSPSCSKRSTSRDAAAGSSRSTLGARSWSMALAWPSLHLDFSVRCWRRSFTSPRNSRSFSTRPACCLPFPAVGGPPRRFSSKLCTTCKAGN